MAQIVLKKVGFGYTDMLFEDIDLTITEKDRIGIVGNNGEGKSTLLKCIAGVIEDYQGQIIKPKNMVIGFMEQEIPDYIKNMSLYDAIADKISSEERDSFLWKVDVALDTFHAPEVIRSRPIKELSGGWQRLALLARVVMSNPDILLLDEPTNHLDVAKIMALEEWLKTQVYDIPAVVVSHDRGFLDSFTNRTVFLRGGQMADYKYSYSRAKDLLYEDDKAAASQREKELKELERLQKSAHNLRQIGVDNYSSEALRKAKQIEKRVERLRSQLTAVYVEPKREIKLNTSETYTNRLLALENVDVTAPDGTVLFHIDKLDISQGERIVLLGANGSGKSQFIRHLNHAFAHREQSKTRGISVTPTAILGYVDQHLSNLPLDMSLIDFIREIYPMDQQRATGMLVGIGFHYGIQDSKIRTLSQGQRSRLNVLMLRLIEPNFYIMDEPTNHLDIAGQEALEREILQHAASCILVSHDRTFVSNLGTRFYEIYEGGLREIESPEVFYQSLSNLEEGSSDNEPSKKTTATNSSAKNSEEHESKLLQMELKKNEKRITELEQEIKSIENSFVEIHTGKAKSDEKIYAKYNKLKDELDLEMRKWEYLAAKVIN